MPKGVWESPWSPTYNDYLGRTVVLSLPFNNSTLAIINPGLTVTREPGCLMDTLMIGRREDGTYREFPIPEGTTIVSRQMLAAAGFATIQDVTNANVTVGRSGG